LEKYSIIVADDHEIVRMGIAYLISRRVDMVLANEAASFFELMEMLSKSSYDMLILDLNLGDTNGIQTISKIHALYPNVKILVLSMYPEDPYALQSIRSGASGYINKSMVNTNLTEAIKQISKGNIYLDKAYQETLPYGSFAEENMKNPITSLSKREREVYGYLTSGLTFKEISEEMGLSPKTVSTYRSRILDKLGLSSTYQLIQFTQQNSLGQL